MEILVTLAIARRPFFTLEKAQDGHVILKYCKAQESFPHGSHIRPDEYLCSSRDREKKKKLPQKLLLLRTVRKN